jgi:hypothetical protein
MLVGAEQGACAFLIYYIVTLKAVEHQNIIPAFLVSYSFLPVFFPDSSVILLYFPLFLQLDNDSITIDILPPYSC